MVWVDRSKSYEKIRFLRLKGSRLKFRMLVTTIFSLNSLRHVFPASTVAKRAICLALGELRKLINSMEYLTDWILFILLCEMKTKFEANRKKKLSSEKFCVFSLWQLLRLMEPWRLVKMNFTIQWSFFKSFVNKGGAAEWLVGTWVKKKKLFHRDWILARNLLSSCNAQSIPKILFMCCSRVSD